MVISKLKQKHIPFFSKIDICIWQSSVLKKTFSIISLGFQPGFFNFIFRSLRKIGETFFTLFLLIGNCSSRNSSAANRKFTISLAHMAVLTSAFSQFCAQKCRFMWFFVLSYRVIFDNFHIQIIMLLGLHSWYFSLRPHDISNTQKKIDWISETKGGCYAKKNTELKTKNTSPRIINLKLGICFPAN